MTSLRLHTEETPLINTMRASLELTTAAAYIEQATKAHDRLTPVDAAIAALKRCRAILTGEPVGPVPGACREDVTAD